MWFTHLPWAATHVVHTLALKPQHMCFTHLLVAAVHVVHTFALGAEHVFHTLAFGRKTCGFTLLP